MYTSKKKAAYVDPGSPYFQFNMTLSGVDVFDNQTNKVIPKYILWARIGKKLNDEAIKIMKMQDDRYSYLPNVQRRNTELRRALLLKDIDPKRVDLMMNTQPKAESVVPPIVKPA